MFSENVKSIKPTANNIFSCQNLNSINFLTRLRLGLSHHHERKLKNNFQDRLNPLCTCGCDVKNIRHFLLHCPNILAERNTLLNKITNTDSCNLNQADVTKTKTLLFSISKYSNEVNLQILNANVDFILTLKKSN